MAKRAYLGAAGVARKIKKMYVGVNGKARKVKKAYIGIGGAARLFFSAGYGDAPEGTYALVTEKNSTIYHIDPNTMASLGSVSSGLAPINDTRGGIRDQTIMMAAGGCAGEYVISAMECYVTGDDDANLKWNTGIVNPQTGAAGTRFETRAQQPVQGAVSSYIVTRGTSGWQRTAYNAAFRDPVTYAQIKSGNLIFDDASIILAMSGAPVGGNDGTVYLVHPQKRTSSLRDFCLERYDLNTLAHQASVNMEHYVQYGAVGNPDIGAGGYLYVFFRQTYPNDFLRQSVMKRDPNTLALVSEVSGIAQWWSTLADIHSVK